MLAKRASDAERSAARRARKLDTAVTPPAVTRDASVTSGGVGHEFDTKHQAPEPEEEKKPTALSATPTIPCPYDRIVALYHDRLPGLPRVKLMPKARQASLRKLWGWVLSSAK